MGTSTDNQRIVTAEDLCRAVGALYDPSWSIDAVSATISLKLYKDTACGAWAKLVENSLAPKGRPKLTRWRVRFQRGLDGWYVNSLRRVGGPILGSQEMVAMLQEVLDYVGLDREKLRKNAPDRYRSSYREDLDALAKAPLVKGPEEAEGNERFRVIKDGFEMVVTFRVRVQHHEVVPLKLLLGSIVEGVDAVTVTHEIRLPCRRGDITEAIEAVEAEALEIWNDTHGCESCGQDDGHGVRRVNPECAACNGQGMVL